MESNFHRSASTPNDALSPLAPGSLIRIAHGALAVDIAPSAGGRVAQITFDRIAWLVGHSHEHQSMIAWGSYPMLPWAGRIRHGRFHFRGRDYQLALNFGHHAIHGVAFGTPWQVDEHSSTHVDLSLQLPEDEHWPFGGTARQRMEVSENRLRMTLTLTAGEHAMPATIGWHPWFLKPDRFDFEPSGFYPRDAEGITSLPLAQPPSGPWDDCFINDKPVLMRRLGQTLRLTSDCNHWVIYDETDHATCVEPQTGPPDAFNLAPASWLSPGSSISAWFVLEWV